jgi:tRNA (guanine-N7-)-methyltransferase
LRNLPERLTIGEGEEESLTRIWQTMGKPKQWTSLAQVQAIERFTVPWQLLDWPPDWEALFGRPGPLVLEIGFGNGAFLVDRAKIMPEANHVGVEISWESVQRLLKRLFTERVGNVRAVEGDGSQALRKLFAPGALHEVYLNHPDPWNKEKHFKRVIIQPEFVSLLASRLAPGGQLTIVTDHERYAGWISEVLKAQDGLRSCFPSPFAHSLPGRTPTKYERKFLEAGQPIHYFVWRRLPDTGCRASQPPTVCERFGEMPNVLFQCETELDYLLSRLDQDAILETQEGLDIVIKLLRVYRDAGSRNELVEVWVKEGPLIQQFGVVAMRKEGNRLLVRLSALGHPRPTPGVKRAVWHVAHRLLQAAPTMRLVSTNVGDPARAIPDEPGNRS